MQAWNDAVAFELANDIAPQEGHISISLEVPQMPADFIREIIPGDENSLAPTSTLRAANDYRPFSPPLPDSDYEEDDDVSDSEEASPLVSAAPLPSAGETADASRSFSPIPSEFSLVDGDDDDDDDDVLSDFSMTDEAESQ